MSVPEPNVTLDEAHMRLWRTYAPHGQAPLISADEFPWPFQSKKCPSPLGELLVWLDQLGDSEVLCEPYWANEHLRWATTSARRLAAALQAHPCGSRLRDVIAFVAEAPDAAKAQERAFNAADDAGGEFGVGSDWTEESLRTMLHSVLDVCAFEHPHVWDAAAETARVKAERKRKRDGLEATAALCEKNAERELKRAKELRKEAAALSDKE